MGVLVPRPAKSFSSQANCSLPNWPSGVFPLSIFATFTNPTVRYRTIPNPNLKEETSNAYEAGLKGDVAKGVTVRFAVIAVREYLKAKFPDKYVYEAHGYAALQLVTCGGAFDYQTHHYLSNIVVFTKMVKR